MTFLWKNLIYYIYKATILTWSELSTNKFLVTLHLCLTNKEMKFVSLFKKKYSAH
jgi:hypothetical protein